MICTYLYFNDAIHQTCPYAQKPYLVYCKLVTFLGGQSIGGHQKSTIGTGGLQTVAESLIGCFLIPLLIGSCASEPGFFGLAVYPPYTAEAKICRKCTCFFRVWYCTYCRCIVNAEFWATAVFWGSLFFQLTFFKNLAWGLVSLSGGGSRGLAATGNGKGFQPWSVGRDGTVPVLNALIEVDASRYTGASEYSTAQL